MNDVIALREKLIQLALLQHHKPYIHYAQGPDAFDCSGLVWFVYQEICGMDLYDSGYGLSMTTKMMTCDYGKLTVFEESMPNKDLKLLKKGDIVFFHILGIIYVIYKNT